jgi:hypothetical protein
MLGNTRVPKIVDYLLAGGWVAVILAAVLFGLLAGCTEPNPAFEPVQGPIRGGTVPGAPDGGARPDSGTAPDVTAPRADAGGGGSDMGSGDTGAGPAGCPVFVASCAGQKRGVLCRRPSCAGGTETAAGTCDGAGGCEPGAERSCSPGVCMGAQCASACAGPADCGAGLVCMLGTCVACGVSP